MHKTLLVALREFRQRIRQRGTIISMLAAPVILIVVWVLTGTVGGAGGGEVESPLADFEDPAAVEQVIGYVDQAEVIESIPEPLSAEQFVAYADVESAAAALSAGEVGAYYVVPEGYPETGEIERVSEALPTARPGDTGAFEWVLARNLFPDLTVAEVSRLRWPFNQTGPQFISLTPEGETGGVGSGSIVPFIVTAAVMLPLFTSGGYLFQSLINEKESRILEILLLSLRPRQLLMGKLLGLGALTLVQYLAWVLITGVAAALTGAELASLLQGINVTVGEAGLAILYALGGYALYAGLMAGIGALAKDMESTRAWIFVITLPIMIPIYLWMVISSAPNGAVAVGLSLFPFSAPVTMLLRMTSTTVPLWQIAASLVLLALTAFGIIWLMARLFRAQTLLSGEELSARRFLAAMSG